MSKLQIPEGYQAVMPYLIVIDAAGLLKFMVDVFDAQEKYKEMRDEDKTVIKHAEVTINGSTIMFAESITGYPPQNAAMFIYIDDCDKSYKKAIDNGAKSLIEPNNRPYGRTSGVKDPFGNTWWITNP